MTHFLCKYGSWTAVAAVFCALAMAATARGEETVVHIESSSDSAPRWAEAELEWLDSLSTCYHTLLDKFHGRLDSSPVKELTQNGGCDDDWAEAVAIWDFYLLNRHEPELQKAYIDFWNAVFKESRMPDRNPFWCTGGFDAEHTSELFQLLWACIELDPDNNKLISDNKRCIDFVIEEVYDPGTRLMRSSYHLRGKLDRKPGDIALNTIWLNAAFHAYITTGDRRYRNWALEYGKSWNELAEANDGVYPYYVPPGTRKIGNDWYKTPWRGFGYYSERGNGNIIGAMRALHSLPTSLSLLDNGDADRHSGGIKSMLKTLFDAGTNGLPACSHDGSEWVRRGSGNWAVPRMLDNAYALTFDPALKAIFTNYIASAKSNNARTEYTFLKYPAFYYFGLRTVEDITSEFSRRGRQLTEKADSYRRKKPPESGDDLRARFTPYPSGMEYIAGSLWGRYDNGRCGGPVPGSIRYFAGRGQPGLPLNIAALVTRVGKEHVEVLFYNRDTKPVSVFLVAGWYGQHNWTLVTTSGGVDKRISARTVKLVLGPGASGSVKLGIDRFVYPPSLDPLSSSM